MSRTNKHKRRWELKQDDSDLNRSDRFFELNTPSKSYKRGYKQAEKAKIKQAIKNEDFDKLPTFKKCHKENWFLDW